MNIFELIEKVSELERQGKEVIKMYIGEPLLKTPDKAIDVAIKELKKGYINYNSVYGITELREEIGKLHNVSYENIIIVPGATSGLFGLLKLLTKPNDSIVIFEPAWPGYKLAAKELNINVKVVDLSIDNNWDIDFDKLEEVFDNSVKALIFNNPTNPTSKLYPKSIEKKLIKFALDKNIFLIFDDAYRYISFDNLPYRRLTHKKVIYLNSFSKNKIMSGWRIGYILADKEIIEGIANYNRATIVNVPVFIQKAALSVLRDVDVAKELIDLSRKNSIYLYNIFKENGFRLAKPGAAFYLFPEINIKSDIFASKLLKEGIAITPGSSFGNYSNFIRMTIAFPEEIIESVANKIMKLLKN